MKRNLFASLTIWFVFMNLAPVGLEITRDSTIGNILQHVEPFNNSDNVTTKSPSLIEGILKGNLVVTPDAGASIGQIDYVSKSMKNFKLPTWDPYMQSGRPMFPADGYNTGILDPFQFAVSFLPIDIVQKIALTSAIWTFVFIFFSMLIFRFFTDNPWAQIMGVLTLVSSKAFHYVPNHLITLGAWVCGVIAFYLVLRLLREDYGRATLGIAFLLGLSLLNFSAFGLGITVFISGCGFLVLVTKSSLFSLRPFIYLLHFVFSIFIALPHILTIRDTQISSTNSQIPYVSKAGGLVEILSRVGSRISFPIFILIVLTLIITFMALRLSRRRVLIGLLDILRTNTALRLCAVTFILAALGLAGLFEKINYQLGLNIQSVNLFPLPLAIAFASFLTYLLTYLNEWSSQYVKPTFLVQFIFPILVLALLVSPFNAIHEIEIRDAFFLCLLSILLWFFPALKKIAVNNSFLLLIISIWIFLIPVAHQFYGNAFSVQNYNETLRKQICSIISCSSSHRFLAIHSTDSAGIPALTYENANSFLYYPTTSSLYGFFEASGGLSLNSIDYADFIATINTGVFPDNPDHPGSKQFLLAIRERILQREDIEFETAVTIQNRRNNNLVWNPDSPLVRYLSVKYLISSKELPESNFYDFVHKFSKFSNLGRDMSYKIRVPEYFVYEVKDSIARAHFPSKVVIRERDTSQTLKDLAQASNFNLGVIDDDAKTSTISQVAETAKVVAQNLDVNSVQINTVQSSSQYLLINENFHPGWTAVLNGKKVKILRANSVFMAVKLPEGKNYLELNFQLFDSKKIFFYALAPLLILMVLLIVGRRKDRVK
jgi:hypothetical protein